MSALSEFSLRYGLCYGYLRGFLWWHCTYPSVTLTSRPWWPRLRRISNHLGIL